jgi:unsaturated rhamnogalacturonyl hydrolase
MYETGPNGPYKPIVRNVSIENVKSTSSPRVMWIASFPGAIIDNVNFIDCVFRGVEAGEVMDASGSILFKNVKIEPANKGRSLNSRPAWP